MIRYEGDLEIKDQSPSLRGSGLKSHQFRPCIAPKWSPSLRGSGLKSESVGKNFETAGSPSLRGSGLKLGSTPGFPSTGDGLPLYEGVD